MQRQPELRGGMLPTGGPLNYLNEAAGTNSRNRSVPIMQLVSYHKPDTPEECEALIAGHCTRGCPCGLRSKGTVKDFAQNLYDAQFTTHSYRVKYPEQPPFTLEDCYAFMHSLFCVGPLRGLQQEKKSKAWANTQINATMHIRDGTPEEDFDYAVDYVVMKKEPAIILFGVQVKPDSFFRRSDSVAVNNAKHSKWGHPVIYHTYRNTNLQFIGESNMEFRNKIMSCAGNACPE